MRIFSMSSVHIVITIHDVSIQMNRAGTKEGKMKNTRIETSGLFSVLTRFNS